MKPIIHAIAAAIILGAAALSSVFFLRACVRAPVDEVGRIVDEAHRAVDLGKRIVDGLERRLNLRPEVRIDRETEMESDRAGLHLVTVKRDFTHEFRWEHKWAGSTKSMRLKGHFTASAGFDLDETFYLNINSEDSTVDLSLPEARLIACELNDYKAEEDDGWWNRITPEERHQAVNDMVAGAKLSMQKNENLLREARRQLESQVAGVIEESGGKPGNSNGIPFSSQPKH